MFTPIPGEMIQFDFLHIFSDGLVQPQTSLFFFFFGGGAVESVCFFVCFVCVCVCFFWAFVKDISAI